MRRNEKKRDKSSYRFFFQYLRCAVMFVTPDVGLVRAVLVRGPQSLSCCPLWLQTCLEEHLPPYLCLMYVEE